MKPYSISYRFGGCESGITLWARDRLEAERRLKAIWETGDVLGEQVVDAPVLDSRPVLQALADRVTSFWRRTDWWRHL